MPSLPNSQSKVTPPPRTPLTWPDKIRANALYAGLKRRPPAVVGPDPADLVRMIEESFKSITLRQADGVGDVLCRGGEQLFERDVANIQSAIRRLGKSTPASVRAMYAANRTGNVETSTFDVDPVLVAAQRLLQTDDMTAVDSVANAFRVLAEVERKRLPPSGGRAAVVDPIFMIVRGVVAYLTHHNMPVRARWDVPKPVKAPANSRDQDSTCLLVSEDTELLRLVTDLLGIRVSNATLRGALRRYLAQLQKENRGPSNTDTMLINFTQ